MAIASGILFGLVLMWGCYTGLARMFDKSGGDWGLAYNMWERDPEKQQANARRGVAMQHSAARRLSSLWPLAIVATVAAAALLAIHAA